MQPHGSKYYPPHPPPPPQTPQGPGVKRLKIKLFQNIVMLHIKGNRECSNMVANADRGTINRKHIKPDIDRRPVSDPLVDLGGGVKVKLNFFRTWSYCI